jgi:hypothetical protein
VIGQTVGGQIGGRSIELRQIACISPLTHLQTQSAEDVPAAIRSASAKRSRLCIAILANLAPPYYFKVSIQILDMRTLLFVLAAAVSGLTYAQSDPPVKMSSSGICHPKGGAYYSQTKKFTAYTSMEDCLKAGGRQPKK